MWNTDNVLDYLEFVEERHRMWERRQNGDPGPWTGHKILQQRKFTNVYRVLDHGSQFLVRELLDPDIPPRDILARCFLYRHTNRPEAWTYAKEQRGFYPFAESMGYDLMGMWKALRDSGSNVFSGAYMIYPQTSKKGSDKIEQVVQLTRNLFHPYKASNDIVPAFLEARTQAERFTILRSVKGVADFMSMQILTDWGYSQQCGEDRENEFVVLGPGARRGALALNPDQTPYDTFLWALSAVRQLPRCPSLTVSSGSRPPSSMDVQNTLCEFSKWVRYRDKEMISSTPYQPAHPGPQQITLPDFW